MANGVDLHRITVEPNGEQYVLRVVLSVTAENEFDAIGWLVSVLNEDS